MWKMAQAVRPLCCFGSRILQISDTPDILFVRPYIGPYGTPCPEFFQDQRGFVIHADAIEFFEPPLVSNG